MALHDIENRNDIETLVDTFYTRVRQDEMIGHIFDSIIGSDWQHHLPIMYQFWETILLQKPGYTGNPVRKHIEIDRKIALEEAHFNRWLELWEHTVNSLFEGSRADEAKKRSHLMIQLMRMKIDAARGGNMLF